MFIFSKNIWFMLGLINLFSLSVFSQKLPFKFFTTADGLAHNRINQIYQDRKGFIWFATNEGLSRFDGYEFVNYGVSDGLPNQIINDVSEDRQGRLWVAANDFGVALFIDKSETDESGKTSKKFSKFTVDEKVHGANKVDRLLIDSKENLWCLTDDGIYRAPVSDNPDFTLIKAYDYPVAAESSKALFEDKKGHVWFGIHNGLFEARGNEIINHGFIDKDGTNFVIDAFEAKDGRILVLSREKGLFEFIPAASAWKKLHGRTEKINMFWSVVEDRENTIWIGGDAGLLKLSGNNLIEYSIEQGLNGDRIISLFQDRESNLWGGNSYSGVLKLMDNSIVGYPLPAGRISLGISENSGKFNHFFCEIDKRTQWMCSSSIKDLNEAQIEAAREFGGILPYHGSFGIYKRRDTWLISNASSTFTILKNFLFSLPGGISLDLRELFDQPYKESDQAMFYVDEENSLWVGRSDGSILRVKTEENGKKRIDKFKWEYALMPDLMISDRQGGLWLFTRGRRGGRLRNGRYESLQPVETIPVGAVSIFLDSRGWMWIGTYFDGLFVCKNPAEEKPYCESFTTENGLLSNSIWAITEDNAGRMYFGTGRGLSRFDPSPGIWNSLTTKDGLTGYSVNGLYKDSQGNIWVNTRQGLTKIDPKLERKSQEPPPIYISHIKIAGREHPISETGIDEAAPVLLDSSQNNLTIDFVGLHLKGENTLTYQYKLEGSGEDWSKPVKNRTISFANLDSGKYRFLVRAINQEGLASSRPAGFQFEIYPPLYRRWWFIALGMLCIALIIYAFYRLRLQKLLEIERTRTLIATDLHDDIGSNLSKISVLSEVVRMQLEREGKSDHKLLISIAEISRESVSSMSDIVWAINPQRDSVLEISRKMREFAEDIFVPKGVTVDFSEPGKGAKIKIPMDLRRDLYLIYKEALNNIAKHSNCTEVTINLDIQHHEIILQIKDNGIGFDLSAASTGNGLANMQKRAERLKGGIQIESNPERGTEIVIRILQS